ncbi:MAG: hypothetical protein FJ102_12650 [Deltaproteobacteria bacterium]|nr:hypothetical protein [Deltaproteobacteria bacterium]
MILALFACFWNGDDDTYPESFATVYCSRLNECYRGAYEEEYDGEMDECIDEVTDDVEDWDDCDFDEDKAADCLEDLRSESCGDFYDGDHDDCWEVYDCGRG